MLDVVRRWNRASHRRIGNDPLQKKLRPRSAIKLCREIGQRLSAAATEKIAAAKRTINNDGDAMLLRERENFLFGFAFHDRVVDLDEIEFLAREDFCDLGKGAGFVMRDAEIPESSLSLP